MFPKAFERCHSTKMFVRLILSHTYEPPAVSLKFIWLTSNYEPCSPFYEIGFDLRDSEGKRFKDATPANTQIGQSVLQLSYTLHSKASDFRSRHSLRSNTEPTQSSAQWVSKFCFRRMTRAGMETDQSPPTSAKFRNA